MIVKHCNARRVEWLTAKEQKEKIKSFWGEQFVRFIPSKDDNYIEYYICK